MDRPSEVTVSFPIINFFLFAHLSASVERPYDPRPYDSRYSRDYDDRRGGSGRGGRYDDYRGGGGGGGREFDRHRDYDRGDRDRDRGGYGRERYDERRY
jgi:transformer-2 protein